MTPPFIRTLVDRAIVESTNDLARELAFASERGLPLAIRAKRQTQGRGRGAHTWWSDSGSLTFTLLLDPHAHALRTEHEPRLALAMGVAVIDAVQRLHPREPIGIRWPNDVEMGQRKLGGILPERFDTPLGPRLAIGVGLNVTTDLSHAPDQVRMMAATLAAACSRPPDPEELFCSILECFGAIVDRLARDDPGLAARWDQLDTLRDCRVEVDLGPRVVAGIGRGIDPSGALRLQREGELLRLFGGQVLRHRTGEL